MATINSYANTVKATHVLAAPYAHRPASLVEIYEAMRRDALGAAGVLLVRWRGTLEHSLHLLAANYLPDGITRRVVRICVDRAIFRAAARENNPGRWREEHLHIVSTLRAKVSEQRFLDTRRFDFNGAQDRAASMQHDSIYFYALVMGDTDVVMSPPLYVLSSNERDFGPLEPAPTSGCRKRRRNADNDDDEDDSPAAKRPKQDWMGNATPLEGVVSRGLFVTVEGGAAPVHSIGFRSSTLDAYVRVRVRDNSFWLLEHCAGEMEIDCFPPPERLHELPPTKRTVTIHRDPLLDETRASRAPPPAEFARGFQPTDGTAWIKRLPVNDVSIEKDLQTLLTHGGNAAACSARPGACVNLLGISYRDLLPFLSEAVRPAARTVEREMSDEDGHSVRSDGDSYSD